MTGEPSKIKAMANDSGAIVFLCSPARLVLFVRYLGHTPGAFWDLAALPGNALARLAVRIGRTGSSSLKQFLASARNCVFVHKLVAQRTELNLERDISNMYNIIRENWFRIR